MSGHVRSVSWLNCLRRHLHCIIVYFYPCVPVLQLFSACSCLSFSLCLLFAHLCDWFCMYCFFVCSLLIFVFFVLLILLLPLTTYLDDCCSLLTLQLLVGVSIQNIIYSIRFWILGGANDNFVVGRMYLIYSIKYWKIRKDRGNFCRRS